MDLSKRYGVDPDLAEGGVWVQFDTGVEFQIRSSESPTVREVKRRLEAPYQHMIKAGRDLPEGVADELAVKLVAEGILVDWRGDITDDGKPVGTFSTEKATALLTKYPALAMDIVMAASRNQVYQNQNVEHDAGNSPKPSAGNSE